VDRVCQANIRPKSHCGKLRSDERSRHEGKVSQAKHHKHTAKLLRLARRSCGERSKQATRLTGSR
jgi:hypothetical protein